MEMSYNKEVGSFGENTACKFLKNKHYKILERNFVSKYGEIDIIAKYKKEMIFVEVKTRRSKAYGGGIGAVNFHKRHNIVMTSQVYMRNTDYSGPRRYDVVEVYIGENNEIIEINHIENGFPWEGHRHGNW